MSLFNERIQSMIDNYKGYLKQAPKEHKLFWTTRIKKMQTYLDKRIKEGKN